MPDKNISHKVKTTSGAEPLVGPGLPLKLKAFCPCSHRRGAKSSGLKW